MSGEFRKDSLSCRASAQPTNLVHKTQKNLPVDHNMNDFKPFHDPHTCENSQSAVPGQFGTISNLSFDTTCIHPGFWSQRLVRRAHNEGSPCCLFFNIHQLVGGLILASLS